MVCVPFIAAICFQSALPSPEQLQRINSDLLAFTNETLKAIAPGVIPPGWPAEFGDGDSYWRSERPLMDWPAGLRRFVLDRFVEQAKSDPKVRNWILSDDAMTSTTLRLTLTLQPTIRTSASSISCAYGLISDNEYQRDESALASLLRTLTGEQKKRMEADHMRVPLSELTDEQRTLLKKLQLPTVTEISPPPADAPIVVFDFYYQASIAHGKDRFSVLLARSTE